MSDKLSIFSIIRFLPAFGIFLSVFAADRLTSIRYLKIRAHFSVLPKGLVRRVQF